MSCKELIPVKQEIIMDSGKPLACEYNDKAIAFNKAIDLHQPLIEYVKTLETELEVCRDANTQKKKEILELKTKVEALNAEKAGKPNLKKMIVDECIKTSTFNGEKADPNTELKLRTLLWDAFGGDGRYGDDGELQGEGIDFKRIPFSELPNAIEQLQLRRFAEKEKAERCPVKVRYECQWVAITLEGKYRCMMPPQDNKIIYCSCRQYCKGKLSTSGMGERK